MPIHQKRPYLISYDIADPRRLQRVHREISEEGLPLQYSVFYCYCSPQAIQGLMARLKGIIAATEDDIRVYSLPRRVQVDTLGKTPVAQGVMLYGDTLPEGIMGRREDPDGTTRETQNGDTQKNPQGAP